MTKDTYVARHITEAYEKEMTEDVSQKTVIRVLENDIVLLKKENKLLQQQISLRDEAINELMEKVEKLQDAISPGYVRATLKRRVTPL